MKKKDKKYFNILSLSGGGVRGIFQAKYLEKLDDYLEKNYNIKITEYFDLITGTSTGAIIASALAFGKSSQTISNIYNEKMHDIFKKNIFSYISPGGRYNQERLRCELKKIFGGKQIRDAKTGILLTATCLNMYSHKIFTNLEKIDDDISIVDAILASTAAPTYFNAVKPDGQERAYVDGGMWANSPALEAILYVNKDYKQIPLSNIRVFSVGNGKYPSGLPINDYNNRIVLNPQNLSTVLDLMFISQEDFCDSMVNKLICKNSYISINIGLDNKIQLDDVERALQILPGLAEKSFDDNLQKMKEFFDFDTVPINQEKGKSTERVKIVLESLSVNSELGYQDSFTQEALEKMKEMGIIDCTDKLEGTQFAPLACMKNLNKKLMFSGVSGSKWIQDPLVREEFKKMMDKIVVNYGKVCFLIIDPACDDYKKMKERRKGTMSTAPYPIWRQLQEEYSSYLEVKCYEHIPTFRLQLMDDSLVAVSRYQFILEQYKEYKAGWGSPHLIIKANSKLSFYHVFETCFLQEWNKAKNILDIDWEEIKND